MVKVVIEIEFCEQCPHSKTERLHTDDSWDDCRKVYCSELKRDVHSYLDWYDKSTIPDDCPFKD